MATASPATLSELVSRDEVAEGTTAFRFEKPGDWTFKAGQFLDMTLVDPSETDAEGNRRTFSIASAPHEETLMVATRMMRHPRSVARESTLHCKLDSQLHWVAVRGIFWVGGKWIMEIPD